MGAGLVGKVVAVVVDGRKYTAAAFEAAIASMAPEDRLLIIFARPLKSGSVHYNMVTKPIQRRFDKLSAQLLAKYSARAAEAKVQFEAVEVDGNHVREAVLRECYLSMADVLFEAGRTTWERLVKDKNGYNFCPKCNSYLRPGGRFAGSRACYLEHTQHPPCPIVQVPAIGASRRE